MSVNYEAPDNVLTQALLDLKHRMKTLLVKVGQVFVFFPEEVSYLGKERLNATSKPASRWLYNLVSSDTILGERA